jgi:hypothetical protein
VDEDVLAAVLIADTLAAEISRPVQEPELVVQTPVWAAAALRADEYDARTQSSAQSSAHDFDENDWHDDVSPVREVHITRTERTEPTFSEMRFDENLGLVEVDSQPLLATEVAAEVEPEMEADWAAEVVELATAAEAQMVELTSDLTREPESESEPESAPLRMSEETDADDFVFGSAIAPQSEFDMDMADDGEMAEEDDINDDEDIDERDTSSNWFIDEVDSDDGSQSISDTYTQFEYEPETESQFELESEPSPTTVRVVPELDDMLDETDDEIDGLELIEELALELSEELMLGLIDALSDELGLELIDDEGDAPDGLGLELIEDEG